MTEVQATIQALAIVESLTNDIDTLAVLDRQVKDLTAKCKKLKDDIANTYGEGKFRGEKYGVKVTIANRKGAGSLAIRFASLDQLDGLLQRLRGPNSQ